MKHDIAHYDRLADNDPGKTYAWLHERVEALMYRERLQRNRDQQTAAHALASTLVPELRMPLVPRFQLHDVH